MAIQVSGSTVIHDSQDVQVSGMFTASSFVGDASQLTNLPASGGTLEATASGTLSDGSKVVINTDGTVSVVAQTQTQTESTGAGIESEVIFENSYTDHPSAVYDSANQKVVIAYRDQGDNNCKVAVGGVSGTSISFGTPVTFDNQLNDVSAAYDSNSNKIVIAYRDGANNSYGTAIVGTVSGTSASFGTPVVYDSTYCSETSVVYDSTNQKVVIAYKDGYNQGRGTAIVGTVSGTSISFGSDTVFNSSGETRDISTTFDSANGKVVIAYCDYSNSYYGTAIVGTVSGTSISFGSEVVFESATTTNISSVYDPTNGKVVIAYRDSDNSGYGTAIVGTVSGTSISFGSPVVFNPTYTVFTSTVFDSANNKAIIAYRNHGNDGHGTVIAGTVSGNSISFDTASTFSFSASNFISAVYDPNSNKVVAAFQNSENNDYGTAVLIGTTGFSIPQLGSKTVFNSSSTAYVSGVYDPTNQKVVIAYRDSGNNSYGTAIVGTVSGTSISFGSEVVFESASTEDISVVYDSTNNKVVIAYRDAGNSDSGTAIVGTVSGTSISFGSPAVFKSSYQDYVSAVYDSANQKVVIAYRDSSNSYYGTSIVGTVSGTSISFGSEVVFNSGNSPHIDITYDSTNQKVVISYADYGNSGYGTSKVGTVSGTSISFGSASTFQSAAAAGYISSVYDSTNQKVVISYQDTGNNFYGTAVVGTVSGTNISFGTPVVFDSNAACYFCSATFDSTNDKVVIAFRDDGNSSYGTAVVGTVSGTSISFGSKIVFESAEVGYLSLVYDSSNDRVVISYKDQGNSEHGTAVVFTPFTTTTTITNNLTAENFIGISNGAYSDGQTATIQVTGSVDDAQSGLTAGQAYYVQVDGTLSETADSPSVFAGTAVSASKIIVKG